VLRGVERAEELAASSSRPSSCSGSGGTRRLGLERRLGQVEADELERRLVADRLALVADDLLGDAHAAEGELEAEARSARSVSSIDVIVSFFACV
jgi:hypothetical protein